MNTLYLIQLTFFQPKYTGKLLESKKKRDLENLLRDERKQAKERKAEGEEFKDKDVFVTSAYRKQLEETVKFRKELEDSDKIDGKPLEGWAIWLSLCLEMTSVQGQQMWRENFGKKLLEDRLKDRFGDVKSEQEDEEHKSEVPDAKRIKLEEGLCLFLLEIVLVCWNPTGWQEISGFFRRSNF